MNKKLVASLVSCFVLGSVSAYAANPFSDVEPSSWAYQSVEQLASAGIINGYPDGTFKGNKDITRYEMAQMVAKAMANQDRSASGHLHRKEHFQHQTSDQRDRSYL